MYILGSPHHIFRDSPTTTGTPPLDKREQSRMITAATIHPSGQWLIIRNILVPKLFIDNPSNCGVKLWPIHPVAFPCSYNNKVRPSRSHRMDKVYGPSARVKSNLCIRYALISNLNRDGCCNCIVSHFGIYPNIKFENKHSHE